MRAHVLQISFPGLPEAPRAAIRADLDLQVCAGWRYLLGLCRGIIVNSDSVLQLRRESLIGILGICLLWFLSGLQDMRPVPSFEQIKLPPDYTPVYHCTPSFTPLHAPACSHVHLQTHVLIPRHAPAQLAEQVFLFRVMSELPASEAPESSARTLAIRKMSCSTGVAHRRCSQSALTHLLHTSVSTRMLAHMHAHTLSVRQRASAEREREREGTEGERVRESEGEREREREARRGGRRCMMS